MTSRNTNAVAMVIIMLLSLNNSIQSTTANNNSIKAQQVESYVSSIVDNLLYPNNSSSEILQLKRSITDTILNSFSFAWIWGLFGYERCFDQTHVYNGVIDGIVSFIEQQSYIYALQKTNNQHIARKIANKIRDEALAIITKSSELPLGVFARFVGSSLQTIVNEHCNRFDTPYQQNTQQHHPQGVYPSEECCICYDSFADEVERIFLTPCGHDMCTKCCKQHFFVYNNSTCPKCRAKVNLTVLNSTLYAPSAPPPYL